MIKACIFDLDGTLLDTLESIRYYLNSELEKYGLKGISLEQTKVFVGKGARELVIKALGAAGLDVDLQEGKALLDKIHRDYVENYNLEPAYLTKAYDGIELAVSYLYNRGIKLAVLSNKPDATVKQLIAKFFPDKFEIVEGAHQGKPLKPDPTSVLEICSKLSVLPEETLYFGDTSTDMQTAKNYGAKLACGVLWGFRNKEELMLAGADAVIDTPEQIISLPLE